MRNSFVYIINPNFRLQSNYLSVEWVLIDLFTLQMEVSKNETSSVYHKGGNLVICQRYGHSLHFVYAEIADWESRELQKWLRDKLKAYIIDTACRVLPQRMHELEHQHHLFAKKVIIKKLRKCVLGQCYKEYQTIVLSPKIILLPQKYMDSVILHEIAHLKFSHHRKAFWDFLTTLLGEDSILQKVRMDVQMKTFYRYSDFLLK